MPVYSDKFLETQIGRSIAIHYDPPHGVRRKSTVEHGMFMGVKDGMLVVRVRKPGEEEYSLHVEQDADQPAFARRNANGSVWWEWTSPQRPLPPGFKDE
jgi:hypothetical protein